MHNPAPRADESEWLSDSERRMVDELEHNVLGATGGGRSLALGTTSSSPRVFRPACVLVVVINCANIKILVLTPTHHSRYADAGDLRNEYQDHS